MSSPTPGQTQRILVVDDDFELRELLEKYFRENGYDVVTADAAPAMDRALERMSFDLIVLDLMLPGEDGLTIAKRLKQTSNVPIIILSAQGSTLDRIVGLEVGADDYVAKLDVGKEDYVAKPFNPRELLARVRAVLRRSEDSAADIDVQKFAFGEFHLNPVNHQLTKNGQEIELTSGDFDLLYLLVQNPNQVLDRRRILMALAGSASAPVDRTVDVRITRLRSKIEPDPSSPTYIKTVWGKGYIFRPDAR